MVTNRTLNKSIGEEFLVLTGSKRLDPGFEYEVISIDGDLKYTFTLRKDIDKCAELVVGEIIPAIDRPVHVLVEDGDRATLIKRPKSGADVENSIKAFYEREESLKRK